MYEEFKRSGDLEATLKEFAGIYAEAVDKMPPIPVNLLADGAKDKIYMVIINTESNKDILKDVPHREVNDTSVIYRIMVSEDEKGIGSALITNHIAEKLGMDEEQLFGIAAGNTPKLFPPVVKPMSQVIFGMLTEDGSMPKDVAEQVVEGMRGENEMMWIITNSRGVSGAVNMLFEKNLHELSNGLGDDLYILPSSTHEVIAVPAKMGNPEELAEMVHQVNMDVVDTTTCPTDWNTIEIDGKVIFVDRWSSTFTVKVNKRCYMFTFAVLIIRHCIVCRIQKKLCYFVIRKKSFHSKESMQKAMGVRF